jgi:hypothetical protein
MKTNRILFAIVATLISIISYSQNTSPSFPGKANAKNPDRFRNNSLSYNLSGTTQYLGISYDRIFSKRLSVELGLGVLSVGVGVKVYLLKIQNNKFNYHTGITAIFCGDPLSNSSLKNYLPFGISYLLKDGIVFAADLGPITSYDLITKSRNFSLYGNLKAGVRF